MDKQIMKGPAITRRNLLVGAASTTGGLAVAFSMTGCANTASKMDEAGKWSPNAWLDISPEGKVVFTLDRVEMGQGTYTGLTTLIAEELNQSPDTIEVKFAGAAQQYRNPDYGLQITGGSNSLSSAWKPIRVAAAAVREMLEKAAADTFGVDASSVVLFDGVLTNDAGQTLNISEVIAIAAKQSVPSEPALKAKQDFRFIGKHSSRLDAAAKVQGTANFGIDASVDDMVFAVVLRSPAISGRLKSFDASELNADKDFIGAYQIDTGVAVVAKSYWKARKLSEKVSLDWDLPQELISTKAAFELYRDAASKDDGDVVREVGDAQEAIDNSSNDAIELEFEMPFLAHATMEPMNCLEHVQEDRADIWASTQGPDIAQVSVAKVTHLDLDEVHIHNQFIGGGFGRRLNQDFIGEAAEISMAAKRPVKLVWSREDDMKNDFYRPATFHRLQASVSDSGEVEAWKHHVVGPGVMDWYIWDAAPAMFPSSPKFMFPMLGKMGLATQGTPMTPADRSAYEGADDLEYEFKAQEISYSKADIGVPVGYWRAVGHSHNGFVTETFVDACAEKAGKDELAFRLDLLKNQPRLASVLKLAAEKGGWGAERPQGRYVGIAAHKSFGSYVAELVELSVESGQIRVHKVVCAVDCGQVVNPDIVKMQMESCIVFGITAALHGEIEFVDGGAAQSNFHDYQMLRMNECPEIDVHIVDSAESPTGVGEPGLPPIAAAMGSAIYKATGTRHTRLPFKIS
ncbi:hypothetical protein A3715_16380 [Oleiphilus sp. HI0009]|nr:hypothetical protein A3715_16380 [Oleiphilus sp. HI0009]